jgi:Fe-Mn family superoxide dismutase
MAKFELPPLPYAYDALEPHIDARTMEIHHTKHHQAYVDNLNKALEGLPQFQGLKLEDLLTRIKEVPESSRQAVINHGGGHANHSFFWTLMAPKAGGMPSGVVADALSKAFGSFDKFKEEFSKAAMGRFGSGWAWLVKDKAGKLSIISTPNQDSPLMQGLAPMLGLDVWEHAYYLKYQNRRADYVAAWWNVVNWKDVTARLEKAPR